MAQYKVIRPFWSNQHLAEFDPRKTPVVELEDEFVKEHRLDESWEGEGGAVHTVKVERIQAKRGPKPKTDDDTTTED